MHLAERLTYLRVLDNAWIEHLEAMDSLRNGIGLRAIGQRDPLVEYKSEAYKMYQQLITAIEAEIAGMIFRVNVTLQSEEAPVETSLTKAAESAAANTSEVTEKVKKKPTKKSDDDKVGRNDPCPCGSGLKYKKCGMINAPEHRG